MSLNLWERRVSVEWWIGCSDGDLITESNQRWVFTIPEISSVFVREPLPLQYSFGPVYPNPFNPTTSIDFTIAEAGFVSISVWNAAGRNIETILSRHLPTGSHSTNWDAQNEPTGIYIYILKTDKFSLVTKRVLFAKINSISLKLKIFIPNRRRMGIVKTISLTNGYYPKFCFY